MQYSKRLDLHISLQNDVVKVTDDAWKCEENKEQSEERSLSFVSFAPTEKPEQLQNQQ